VQSRKVESNSTPPPLGNFTRPSPFCRCIHDFLFFSIHPLRISVTLRVEKGGMDLGGGREVLFFFGGGGVSFEDCWCCCCDFATQNTKSSKSFVCCFFLIFATTVVPPQSPMSCLLELPPTPADFNCSVSRTFRTRSYSCSVFFEWRMVYFEYCCTFFVQKKDTLFFFSSLSPSLTLLPLFWANFF